MVNNSIDKISSFKFQKHLFGYTMNFFYHISDKASNFLVDSSYGCKSLSSLHKVQTQTGRKLNWRGGLFLHKFFATKHYKMPLKTYICNPTLDKQNLIKLSILLYNTA